MSMPTVVTTAILCSNVLPSSFLPDVQTTVRGRSASSEALSFRCVSFSTSNACSCQVFVVAQNGSDSSWPNHGVDPPL